MLEYQELKTHWVLIQINKREDLVLDTTNKAKASSWREKKIHFGYLSICLVLLLTWPGLVNFVGIGALSCSKAVKLQFHTLMFDACLAMGWVCLSTSATRHVGISGWQPRACRYIWSWACRHICSLKLKDMRWPAMLSLHIFIPQANLQQTFARLVDVKFELLNI